MKTLNKKAHELCMLICAHISTNGNVTANGLKDLAHRLGYTTQDLEAALEYGFENGILTNPADDKK